jgi:hypothetical protein
MNYKVNRAEVKSKVQTFKVTEGDQRVFVEKCQSINKRPATVLREYVEKFNKKGIVK